MYDNIDFENKIMLIVRKPQEGKTFICISSIYKDLTSDIHIVLTMNTLSSGMQFFGRMEDTIGSKNIIVFNSNKKTTGNCLHAKNTGDVFKLLQNNINVKVIVCCAHTTRFTKSLLQLFEFVGDSKKFDGRKFKIHIDEAHKYICENRQTIKDFHNLTLVRKIIGYTATPDPIISNNNDNKQYFSNIYVCDVEKEYGIIRSTNYFGVKDCQRNIINFTNMDKPDEYSSKLIPENIIKLGLNKNQSLQFYDNKYSFNFGNEIALFRFYDYILPTLKINQQGFSYHFSPAYNRKVSHLQVASIILKHYPDSNIIIINGEGIQLFRGIYKSGNKELTLIKTNHQITVKNDFHRKQLLEPSYIIQSLIEDFCHFPTFVSGFACVGMSVTLVNEYLGNFDHVIMDHSHYDKEELYQLCRFLFNYLSWDIKNKTRIKQTVFVSSTQKVFDICLNYEQHIEELIRDSSGKFMIQDGNYIKNIPPTDKQQRRIDLDNISNSIVWGWKKFDVDLTCEIDIDELGNFCVVRADNFYKYITNKTCPIRSKPKRYANDNKFWACVTTGSINIHTVDELEKNIKGNNWDTYFQLVQNQSIYASRMFVGYEKVSDNKQYRIYIKYAKLDSSVLPVINKWCKKKDSNISYNENDDDSILPGSEEYEDLGNPTLNITTPDNDDIVKPKYTRPPNYALKYLDDGCVLTATIKNIEFYCKYNKSKNKFYTIDETKTFDTINKAHRYHVSLVAEQIPGYSCSKNAWELFKGVDVNGNRYPIDNYDKHK